MAHTVLCWVFWKIIYVLRWQKFFSFYFWIRSIALYSRQSEDILIIFSEWSINHTMTNVFKSQYTWNSCTLDIWGNIYNGLPYIYASCNIFSEQKKFNTVLINYKIIKMRTYTTLLFSFSINYLYNKNITNVFLASLESKTLETFFIFLYKFAWWLTSHLNVAS